MRLNEAWRAFRPDAAVILPQETVGSREEEHAAGVAEIHGRQNRERDAGARRGGGLGGAGCEPCVTRACSVLAPGARIRTTFNAQGGALLTRSDRGPSSALDITRPA